MAELIIKNKPKLNLTAVVSNCNPGLTDFIKENNSLRYELGKNTNPDLTSFIKDYLNNHEIHINNTNKQLFKYYLTYPHRNSQLSRNTYSVINKPNYYNF